MVLFYNGVITTAYLFDVIDMNIIKALIRSAFKGLIGERSKPHGELGSSAMQDVSGYQRVY